MAELETGAQPPDEPGGISCEQARRQIERLVEEGDLKEVERALLRGHLTLCASCKGVLERARHLDASLKAAFSTVDTSAEFTKRVLGAVSKENVAGGENRGSPKTLAGQAGGVSSWPGAQPHHVFRKVVAVAAMVLLFLGGVGAWRALKPVSEAGSAPLLADVSGEGGVRQADGTLAALAGSRVLRPGEVIEAGRGIVSLKLKSGSESLAALVLSPGARLSAANRHSYRLEKGAAYFHVFPDRPKSSPEERFEVDAGGLATVRVTGTVFAVDLNAAGGPNVAVEEGSVEICSPAGVRKVIAGKEAYLESHAEACASDLAARLAWKTPVRPVAAAPVLSRVAPPLVVSRAPQPKMDWESAVTGLALRGKTLPEALALVVQTHAAPVEFKALIGQAEKLGGGAKLSFSLYGSMPLRSVVAWMARDTGLRLELDAGGVARLRAAGAGEPVGPAADGHIPPQVLVSMKAPAAGGAQAGTPDAFGTAAGVTMIFEREAGQAPSFSRDSLANFKTLQEALDATGAAAAWYDHVLYVAAPSTIEALTRVERVADAVPGMLGEPFNPRWARDLKAFLERQRYPAPGECAGLCTDKVLAGKPAFLNLTLSPGGAGGDGGADGRDEAPRLHCATGLLGEALLRVLTERLGTPSPLVSGSAEWLTELAPRGAISGIDALVKQAQTSLPVEIRGAVPPFLRQAFMNRGLRLGEALEYAAWLGGRGIRRENNALIVDDLQTCYGEPSLQVLSTVSLAERRPELAATLPETFCGLLVASHPVLFEKTALGCLKNTVFFRGDRRQLQAAQRLRGELERALERSDRPFDVASWRPEWRCEIDRNLAAPFQALGVQRLSGTFAGLLCQGALNSQLHCTVLTDLAAMKAHAADKMEVQVEGRTVGQVLEGLVRGAGLKVSIEGKVIWVRP